MSTLTKVKSCFILAILGIILLGLLQPVKAVVSPTSQFFVNDYASVLSTETEDYMMSMNQDLQAKTGAQIVVVTVKSLEGKSIEEYATELFRKFGIGDKEKNNGVLLLCSTGERLFRIEVGYGLEGRLTDGKTGRIQDEYIIPYLKENNYDEGMKNGFSAVLEEVSKEYGITVTGKQNAVVKTISRNVGAAFQPLLLVSVVMSMILKAVGSKKSIIKIIYLIFLSIVAFIFLRSLANVAIIIILNLIALFSSGLHISGGGYWRRWRFFWRRIFRRRFWRRFLWRRWLIRRRRKLKRILIKKTVVFYCTTVFLHAGKNRIVPIEIL